MKFWNENFAKKMMPILQRQNSLDSQSGFTLIELLVVIIIIAILAAIAIPMYLSQRQKARDTNIKSDLYSAAVAEFTYYVETAVYTGSLDDLKARGYNQSANISISIKASGNTFCMEAYDNGNASRVFYSNSGNGTPNPQLGTCP